jgi:hypothetical protein
VADLSRGNGRGFLVEDFVQSITAQLDRVQDALALKARTGRPLTFALKDLNVDLKVFWDSDGSGRALLRHAGPNEEGASTLQLAFTTITRAMVEENTVALGQDADSRRLDELPGAPQLQDQDRQALELLGIRTVGQLRQFSQEASPKAVETYVGIPVMRLQAALQQAARPAITGNEIVARGGRPFIRIHGVNLTAAGKPEVLLSGEPVEVVDSSPSELLVRPLGHHREGQIEVLVGEHRATAFYDLPAELAAPVELRRPVAQVEPLEAGEAT